MRRALALAWLLAGASAAVAQTPSPSPSPEGSWTFETAPVNETCRLTGDMVIDRNGQGGLSCRFVALQSCSGSPPIAIRVAQTCRARQSGARIEIESRILRTLSVSPVGLEEAVRRYYAPDNFSVSLNPAGTEMTGRFHSLSEAFVRFRRFSADLVS